MAQQRPVDQVNVFTGTSNSRWMMFPGAAMPFGMVKFSPDNQANVWNGGYEYTINSIAGFSPVHSWAMGSFSIMPTNGAVRTFPGPADGPFRGMWTSGYRARFRKEDETGKPGYYRVKFYDYGGIATELTATTRCGYMRVTFPENKQSNFLFNLNPEYEENYPKQEEAYVRRVSDTEIEGYVRHRSSFTDVYTVHFVARFSKAMKQFRPWYAAPFEGKSLYGTAWQQQKTFYDTTEITLSGDCGLAVQFETQADEQIEMQFGISLVSIEQARLNLDTELKPFEWDFEAVVKNCQDTWNDLLSTVEVEGGTAQDRQKFYTGLYRAYSARTTWSDVNGKYTDQCEQEATITAPGDVVYGCDALWGAHWNLFPLWTLLTPDKANSWCNSLLEMYDRGGWLPQGPSGVEYCEVMVAAHQIKLLVSAYQKGIRNFDAEKAYEAMRKNQMTPGLEHECGGWAGNKNLESLLKYGYVANEDGPVSNTMEFAFDDWAVAQMAKALGKRKDYKYFMERAQNYRKVIDPETRFVRQRHADGTWVQEWDSLQDHGTWYGAGYVEGTAWHYSFFVPHDYQGLIDIVGRQRFIDRLVMGFEAGYVHIGNQPNMQAPFIFNHAGVPWLTQKYVRKLLAESFDTDPLRGYPGEEDQGQLGAWYVLAAMGLFQMDGGCSPESYYDISSPIFDRIVIHLDDAYYSGKDFEIITYNNNPENVYIQSMRLNGRALNSYKIAHKTIALGGKLEITLGPDPLQD